MQIYNIFDLRRICIKIFYNTYVLYTLCLISITILLISYVLMRRISHSSGNPLGDF